MPSSAIHSDSSTPDRLVVGEWTVIPSRNLLVRRGEQVRLEPRVMDLLVDLAERADHPVSKQDLIERVGRSRHVTDARRATRGPRSEQPDNSPFEIPGTVQSSRGFLPGGSP